MAGRRPSKTIKPFLTMHDWEAKHYVVGGRDHPRRHGDVRLQLVVNARSDQADQDCASCGGRNVTPVGRQVCGAAARLELRPPVWQSSALPSNRIAPCRRSRAKPTSSPASPLRSSASRPLAPPAPDFDAAEAFVWRADSGALAPVPRVNRVDLALLRGVDRVRDLLVENTRRFARAPPRQQCAAVGRARHGQVVAGQGGARRDQPREGRRGPAQAGRDPPRGHRGPAGADEPFCARRPTVSSCSATISRSTPATRPTSR